MVKMCKDILFGHMTIFVSVSICDIAVCVFRNFSVYNSYMSTFPLQERRLKAIICLKWKSWNVI